MDDFNDTRRHFLQQVAVLGGVGLGLAGCGGGESAGDANSAEGAGADDRKSAAAAGDPPVAPPPGAIALSSQGMNLASMIVFDAWHEGSRYERYQRLTVLSGATATIKFHGENLAGGGALRPLLAGQYRLLVDGVARATATVATGAVRASFTLDLAPLSQGWHAFDVEIAAGSPETCPRWFMYVDKGLPLPAAGEPIPVASGSYDVAHRGLRHYFGMLPSQQVQPAAWPLPPRECPVFSDPLPYAQMHRENIVPTREGNILRPNRNARGVVSTFNKQSYFWSDLIRKQPPLPLLDGPRNVGTFQMPTTILVSRQGGAYFADPWRVGRVAPDGTVTTRAGYRHKRPHSYYGGAQELELVGDWSHIPEQRRGFHEIWGLAWDLGSLAVDPNKPPIEGENPHATGPRLFVADSQNNRVVLLTFRPDTHEEPMVTEFLTGLRDPWDVAWAGGVLYVTERQSHRIAAYDAVTGAFLRTVVSGAALATVDVNRMVRRSADVAVLRAQPCVAPEGLFHQDGWLYFGSKAQGEVRKVNLETGELKVVCAPTIDGNSQFMKVALSDGTFGPRGTVFTWTWSIGAFGMPMAFLPDGTRWSYHTYENISRGRGGKWETLGYASAGGIGMGRLLTGSSQEGLIQISKALPTDPAPNSTQYIAGQRQYLERGLNLLHGHHGHGHFGLPLPWGESAAIDYYLKWNLP